MNSIWSRAFGPSISRNRIRRVLSFYQVKLTQSAAFEEPRSKAWNSPPLPLWLLLVTIIRALHVSGQLAFAKQSVSQSLRASREARSPFLQVVTIVQWGAYVASISLDYDYEWMECTTRSGHVRLFLLSHADLITRVLTLYRVKRTQSAAFEELRSEPWNSPALL